MSADLCVEWCWWGTFDLIVFFFFCVNLNLISNLCLFRAYGLFLDGDLDRGSTATCTAFLNPPLTGGAHDFKCAAIEVYACT